ncbi:MAG TPA: phosphopyruvate hydratase [Kineosporiaceae bacterium]|nr:phosphopyruvate hydratase [Kineosporiaceae bacterium]
MSTEATGLDAFVLTAVLDVRAVTAVEILDSRSRPTLAVTVTLADGTAARAGVPSGASTGSGEALELRDHDHTRYGGAGVLTAVGNVNGEIASAVTGRTFAGIRDLDQTLIALDGTPNKATLGANAIVGVSMAAARASAAAHGVPLWQALAPTPAAPHLPVPHFNVVNGGVHAANDLDFQEFMIAPVGARTIADAVRAGAETYAALKKLLQQRGHSVGLGDEGGFAPQIASPEDVLTLLVEAVTVAGYPPGREGIAIALDPAASEFHRDGLYHVNGQHLSSADMTAWYEQLVNEFPIWSIEDGLAEDDWDGWRVLTERLGDRVQLVGDDIFVTNPTIIADAVSRRVANAALIKLNQIGSVTETLTAMAVCRDHGYRAMVSHRSGETEDSFIADLATAAGCGQIKSGAPARGERVAKYNRLMEIAVQAPRLAFGLTT